LSTIERNFFPATGETFLFDMNLKTEDVDEAFDDVKLPCATAEEWLPE
jgi:hypothetical protein